MGRKTKFHKLKQFLESVLQNKLHGVKEMFKTAAQLILVLSPWPTNRIEALIFKGKDVDDVNRPKRNMNCLERPPVQ